MKNNPNFNVFSQDVTTIMKNISLGQWIRISFVIRENMLNQHSCKIDIYQTVLNFKTVDRFFREGPTNIYGDKRFLN